MKKRYDIMAVGPGGGHLREMLMALEGVDKNTVLFVTNPLPHLQEHPELHMDFVIDTGLNPLKFVANFFQSIRLVWKHRPSFIISTGGGLSVLIFILGKLVGAKTIFIESGCRILMPSRTGKILYHFADHFIVQSKALLPHYPKSILSSVL